MNEALVIAIIGLLSPPVIDLVNKYVPNKHVRFVVALVISFVVGGALAYVQYGESVLQNATLIFAAQQTVYKLMYEDSKLQTRVRG